MNSFWNILSFIGLYPVFRYGTSREIWTNGRKLREEQQKCRSLWKINSLKKRRQRDVREKRAHYGSFENTNCSSKQNKKEKENKRKIFSSSLRWVERSSMPEYSKEALGKPLYCLSPRVDLMVMEYAWRKVFSNGLDGHLSRMTECVIQS